MATNCNLEPFKLSQVNSKSHHNFDMRGSFGDNTLWSNDPDGHATLQHALQTFRISGLGQSGIHNS